MTIAAGTQVGSYKILSPLGAGGMGEVWLAEDTRLKRKVALKLLPAELTVDTERVRRFEQEAQAASALSHPNIITVYDIGESEAGRFIVMELVAGCTLRSVIAADNSLDTFLSLSRQMAKALSAAHAAGITHRDIKPDNIMVREDGYVKVLDFGLARLRPATENDSEAATLAQQTTPGTLMGTVAYMSPEQARGETVSYPSDIFALGIVLYELATGRHPFKAETLVGYLHAITLQTPAPPQQWQPKLPAALNDLLLRMLDKEASKRPTANEVLQTLIEAAHKSHSSDNEPVAAQTLILPQTTAAASEVLATAAASAQPTSPDHPKLQKWWLAAGLSVLLAVGGYFGYGYFRATKQIESIAVLPFENRSGNADSEYLSDGLAESLIYRLSQLPDLKVSPTSSVFRYKGKETDPQVVAKELGVDSVMTGRITERGDNLTISVNLVDMRNGKSLWGEQYERKLSELLTTQREITGEIVSKLQLKLSGESEQRLAKKYTDDPEAYQLYLKGRFYWNKRTEENLRKAIEQFKAAADKDPNFALANVGLADCYGVLPAYSNAPSSEFLPSAKAYAELAIAIDDSLGEAHISLAQADSLLWNWGAAEKEFKRGLELSPNYATGHQWYGIYLRIQRRFDEALTEIKRAQELEPLSLVSSVNLAQLWLARGDAEASVEQCKRGLELDPAWYYFHQQVALSYVKQGRNAEALAEAEKAVELSNRQSIALGILGYVLAHTGKRREAVQIAEELQVRFTKRQAKGSEIGWIYLGLNEKDETFRWLEKDFENRDAAMPSWLIDYPLNTLRDETRFKDLLKRLKLPE